MARLATLARFELSGEILSEDTVALLTAASCPIPGANIDADEVAAAWDLLGEQWQKIRTEFGSFETERLRSRWIKPFVELLGYDLEAIKGNVEFGDGRSIPLSYVSAEMPFWFLSQDQTYDEKREHGRRKASPHELFQDYLNLSKPNWGILCNGRSIRLLHDYHKTLTRNYVEADLESIFEALDFDAFRAVWRVFRRDAFVPDSKGSSPIEKLRDFSRQEGTEIGKELRGQVLEAIQTLANGFLESDDGTLREALQAPEAAMEFYRALLRIIYRILFLLYIENKPGWTPSSDPVWASSYSITRMREEAEELSSLRSEGEDHWEWLKVVFRIVRTGSPRFDIHPYGGELFDPKKLWLLEDAALRNSDLLKAISLLTVFERKKGKFRQTYRVNFKTLRIDALGSVYEALLDVAPVIDGEGRFGFAEGTERKLTGSYYTPPELVAELVKSALVPVIEDRLKGKSGCAEKRDALLAIKVVDPACGSGAFLIQALDKLTEALLKAKLEGEDPSEEQLREARRDVVTHCIHGVDLNPMAVELCKFTLWLHVAHPRLPLSYLEPLIKPGNALVGVPLMKQVEAAKRKIAEEKQSLLDSGNRKAAAKLKYVGWPDSIPDEAFNAVTGDDKDVCRDAKERNRKEREGQMPLSAEAVRKDEEERLKVYQQMLEITEDTPQAVIEKDRRYKMYLSSGLYRLPKLHADLWCSAFFWDLSSYEGEKPAHHWFVQSHPSRSTKYGEKVPIELTEKVNEIAERVRFFHWEGEFPDVFDQGGFDCVLGNPPWESLQLEEQEFFEARQPQIAKLQGAKRKLAIHALASQYPRLYAEFIAAGHDMDCTTKFIRESGGYRLTASGKVNTYALFSERDRELLSPHGRAGIVVPTGIVTDDTTKRFFVDLAGSGALGGFSALDNEGSPPIFPGIDHRNKFGLIVMLGRSVVSGEPEFTFSCSQVEWIHDPRRRFKMSAADFELLNPNTKTCPVFRSRADAELTKYIYRRVPVLVNEATGEDPWGVSFRQGLFNMTSDSGLFKEAGELEAMGYRLRGNIYEPPSPGMDEYLPLFEAKMIHHYDHRYGTYEGATQAQLNEGTLPNPGQEWKQNPDNVALPRYWVPRQEVLLRSSQVPPDLKQALRRQDERIAFLALMDWLVGWLLNKGDAASSELATELALKYFDGGYPSAHMSAFTAWMNSLRAQETEREFPITEVDRALMSGLSESLAKCQRLVEQRSPRWLLGFRDVASNVTERTAIFSLMPRVGVNHKTPCLFPRGALPPRLQSCFAASSSCLALDYLARQKLGGTSMAFFIVKQLPLLSPGQFAHHGVGFVSARMLELVYTSFDMRPWAEAMGYHGEPFVWNDERRAHLRAELDAYFARLYGLNRKQLRYILDPHGLSDAELEDILDPWEDPTCAGPHCLPAETTKDFPGETFRVLKEKEIKGYGEYRTRRLVLEAWHKLEEELGPVQPLPLLPQPLPKNEPDGLAVRENRKEYDPGQPSLTFN